MTADALKQIYSTHNIKLCVLLILIQSAKIYTYKYWCVLDTLKRIIILFFYLPYIYTCLQV